MAPPTRETPPSSSNGFTEARCDRDIIQTTCLRKLDKENNEKLCVFVECLLSLHPIIVKHTKNNCCILCKKKYISF